MLRRCLRASLRVRYTHTLALPYNAPLAETKKAARKPATNAAPQRHSKLTTHLDRFVGALTVRRSIAECMQREQLLALLREVVTQQYGPGFEVEDINMHVFAHDNSGAMLEFVIVAPPDKSAIGLPNHYRPAEPAHLLSNRGLSDCVFYPRTCVAISDKRHVTRLPSNWSNMATLNFERQPGAALALRRNQRSTPRSSYELRTGRILGVVSCHRNGWLGRLAAFAPLSARSFATRVESQSQQEAGNLPALHHKPVEEALQSYDAPKALSELDQELDTLDARAVYSDLPDQRPKPRQSRRANMDEELWQYYNDRRPSQHILNARAETIEALTKAVNAYAQIICTGKSKHDRYQVATFGSTLVGSDEASSDLDVVVLDPAYETGWRPDIVWTKKPSAMYDIEKLSRFFQRRGFYNLEAIPKARVPILSGRSASTPSVHFDLSVNSRNGLFNSQLIAEYAKVHPHVRPLLVLLKAWSRGNKLDAPAKLVQRGRGRQIGMPRPLSSYIMSNIVVAYMQHEGMLPNLQEPYVSPLFNEDDWSQTALAGDNAKSAYDILRRPPFAKKEHIWWSISRRDTNTRIPHDLRHLDADSAPVRAWIERRRRRMENSGEHERSLADTLRGFFRFFGRDFAYGLQVVSVRDGGIAPRQRQPGWRSPDRFLAQLHRDLVYGAQLPRDGKIPSESLNLDPYRWLREGDSREVDEDIERETARLLAMSTDVESFKSAQFVAIDPIFSEVNLGENFHNAFMKKFVGQCARAENVFSTGLGIRELLATSSSGFVKR